MDDLLGELHAPLFEEAQVFFLAPEIVRQHDRYLVYDGVVPSTLGARQDAVDDQVPLHGELTQAQRVGLVDGAGTDVKELPLHDEACLKTR